MTAIESFHVSIKTVHIIFFANMIEKEFRTETENITLNRDNESLNISACDFDFRLVFGDEENWYHRRIFYEKLEDNTVRCHLCSYHYRIMEGKKWCVKYAKTGICSY